MDETLGFGGRGGEWGIGGEREFIGGEMGFRSKLAPLASAA